MKQQVKLEDGALRLRSLQMTDADFMIRIENNPEVWEVSNNDQPYSVKEIHDFIQGSTNWLSVDKQLRLLIERTADGLPVGFIDLMDYDEMHQRAEVGILVDKPYLRQGYARHAVQMLCRYAFASLGLHQLYAYVPEDNEASLRLFASCGFERVGVLKDWIQGKTGYKSVSFLQRISDRTVF